MPLEVRWYHVNRKSPFAYRCIGKACVADWPCEGEANRFTGGAETQSVYSRGLFRGLFFVRMSRYLHVCVNRYLGARSAPSV